MEMNFDPKEKKREEKQIRRKRWYRTLCGMAAVVVMCTVYTLMLPALTLDNDTNNGSDPAGSASVENVSDSSSAASETGSSDSASSNDSSDSADSNTDGNNNESDSNDSSADSSDSSTDPSDADGSAASTDKDSSAADNNTNDPAQPSGSTSDSDSDTVPPEDSNSGGGQITGSSDGDPDQITDEDSENGEDQESGDNDTEEDSDTDENKSDDTADVETEADWIATLHDAISADNWDEMTWGEKLLAVAETQLGYTESILNFRVDSEGNHKGYTRYGAWSNDPYGDWCAMFVSFCLNYAGIEENETLIPYNDNCMAWVNKLKENKLYQDPDTYLPEAGDIVFFNVNGKGADHVGIVSDVEYGTKKVIRHVAGNGSAIEDGVINMLSYVNDLQSEEGTSELETVEEEVTIAESIEVIEGNSSDKVQKVTYDLTEDNDVIGYVAIFRAEYVYNGGDISEFDNGEALDDAETLDSNIAVATITGENTVLVGKQITVTSDNNQHVLGSGVWKSNDSSIAKIVGFDCNSGKHTATIEGVKAGTVDIKHCTKISDFYEREIDTIKVTVIQPPTAIKITGAETVKEGNNIDLTATLSPDGATGTVTWNSSNNTIATVSSNGKVTGLRSGSVTITATTTGADGTPITAEHEITVVEILKPTSISINGANEVELGGSIELTAVLSPDDADGNIVWSTSDTTIASIDDNGKVLGKKAGTVIITAETIGADGSVISSQHIIQVSKDGQTGAQFYYLKTPTSDPVSNNTNQWGKSAGDGIVDLEKGVTWVNNKNLFDGEIKVVDRVVAWPDNLGTVNEDGSLTLSETSEHWSIIFDAFKTSVEELNNLDELSEDDVDAIILHPYKISRNNGTEPPHHVDCTVEIKCKKTVTATYYLWDAEGTNYEWKAAKNYKSNSNLTTSYADAASGGTDLPAIKTVNNKDYRLVAWYDNPELTGVPVEFPYQMTDQNVNFYAKYIEIDYNINYEIANGCTGYGKINGNITRVTENLSGKDVADGCTAVANDGYIFDGWYTDATCAEKVPDDWVVDGKIIPQKIDGSWKSISGKTYYAKFVTGVVLPETGGEGTALIYLLGAAIMAVPATAAVTRRRRKKMN